MNMSPGLARAALVMHTGSDDIPAKIAPVGSTSKEWVHLEFVNLKSHSTGHMLTCSP